MTKILVALSGGMDSAASVLRLRSGGYDPVGLYIDMLGDDEALAKAKDTARSLGIELLVEECSARFRETVSDYFVDSYLRGETPAPCSVCNPLIKWKITADVADRIGIEKIATGHYCRISELDGVKYITRAEDPVKDQSYYLWGLGSDILDRAIFPLGDILKTDTRRFLKDSGYATIEAQRESMSVCFLRGCNYEEFIIERAAERGLTIAEGDIVDMLGAVVGRHRGLPFYTVGQKRGIENGLSVVALDAERNRIIVGRSEDLYTDTIYIKNWSARNTEELFDSKYICVMVRGIGRNPSGYASVTHDGDDLKITLSDPAWAVAAGQPAVFYVGDRVIGGGIITAGATRDGESAM